MQALLFDLDGTLADTTPLHKRAWLELLKELGVEADDEFYDQRISGRRNLEIVASILPDMSQREGLALADRKEARFRELAAQGLVALPGLHALLAASKQRNWRTALVTNAPPANVQMVAERLQLEFELVIYAEHLPKGKPDPLPYLEALHQLRIEARDAVAFEDSPSGVRSAAGAGISTVGLLTGHSADELTQAGASLCVRDFSAPELRAFLATPSL